MVQGYVSSSSCSPTSRSCPWFPAGWSAWDREGVATSALIQSPPQPGASCISLETGPSESSPLCLSRWSLLVWDKVCSCPFPHWPFLQLQSGSLCPEVVGLPALPTPSEGFFLCGRWWPSCPSWEGAAQRPQACTTRKQFSGLCPGCQSAGAPGQVDGKNLGIQQILGTHASLQSFVNTYSGSNLSGL